MYVMSFILFNCSLSFHSFFKLVGVMAPSLLVFVLILTVKLLDEFVLRNNVDM